MIGCCHDNRINQILSKSGNSTFAGWVISDTDEFHFNEIKAQSKGITASFILLTISPGHSRAKLTKIDQLIKMIKEMFVGCILRNCLNFVLRQLYTQIYISIAVYDEIEAGK
jgi:hypothetical protein